jgi:ABC-type multidrug transport system ATPase subunit
MSPAAPQARNATIAVNGVHKRFGSVHALRGVSLEVPQGGVFGLIGPNGAGKTTLFSLILGYLQPTEGEVRVLGVEPRDLFTLPGKIGALPQDADLPPTVSVHEALVFIGRLAGLRGAALDADIGRVLDFVKLTDVQSRKLRQLSHGMKKRLAIAQALLGQPDLVVLDEPTAGLDPKHAYELGELFRKIAQTTTVVISSHNLTELEHLCDRAAILVKGEIVRQGTMDEIRRADVEVHITVDRAPDQAKLQVPGAQFAFAPEHSRVTLRFEPTAERSAEAVTTEALSALIAQGVLIRTVERGQSLLKTYLEVSEAAPPPQ